MHPHLLRTNVIQWRCASCIETRITLSIQIVFKDLCMLFIAHHIFIAFFYELKFLPKLHLFFLLISLNIFTIQIFFTNSRLFPTFQNLFVTIVRKKIDIFSNWSLLFIEMNFRVEANFSKKKNPFHCENTVHGIYCWGENILNRSVWKKCQLRGQN